MKSTIKTKSVQLLKSLKTIKNYLTLLSLIQIISFIQSRIWCSFKSKYKYLTNIIKNKIKKYKIIDN